MDREEDREKGLNGTERGSDGHNNNGRVWSELVMRLLASVLTLATAVILGVSKETKIVPLKILPTLPPVHVSYTAKSTYQSAFVYNITANAIACGYAAVTTWILTVTRGKKKGKAVAVALLMGDLVTVALLFSGTGAAGAIGLMGFQGNKHVMWNKVCNVFHGFCRTVAASLFVSLLASVAFLILVVFDAIRFM
ncbi:PREDICTED: CASP-like protein 1E2 [Tarenaya hassleriana]|uniref:CASP-like protein 1E2 n=1 Tax=Tarenaya hassleriana TaxID=28532 RepID=UPI00053C221E|nr:PREDICTED: CASP-like protein 1E2 [Tarenaya hassleriana]